MSAVVTETLFLNKGNFLAVDNSTFPYFAFNDSPTFAARNQVIQLATGDVLHLKVINTDNQPHAFAVDNLSAPQVILPGDSMLDTLSFANPGIWIYYDSQDAPKFHYMGAAGMIVVEDPGIVQRFFWNMKENQKQWNFDLDQGGTVNWNNYAPDYFTVNGLSKPDLENDPTAKVTGGVGDQIRIYIANTGRSIHSLHFHGYHARIVSETQSPGRINWSKDTVPIKPMQAVVLELVPDKPGLFPVHDHNLVAVSGGGIYPNGIFIMMDIQ